MSIRNIFNLNPQSDEYQKISLSFLPDKLQPTPIHPTPPTPTSKPQPQPQPDPTPTPPTPTPTPTPPVHPSQHGVAVAGHINYALPPEDETFESDNSTGIIYYPNRIPDSPKNPTYFGELNGCTLQELGIKENIIFEINCDIVFDNILIRFETPIDNGFDNLNNFQGSDPQPNFIPPQTLRIGGMLSYTDGLITNSNIYNNNNVWINNPLTPDGSVTSCYSLGELQLSYTEFSVPNNTETEDLWINGVVQNKKYRAYYYSGTLRIRDIFVKTDSISPDKPLRLFIKTFSPDNASANQRWDVIATALPSIVVPDGGAGQPILLNIIDFKISYKCLLTKSDNTGTLLPSSRAGKALYYLTINPKTFIGGVPQPP
jgi:hypothetical protein